MRSLDPDEQALWARVAATIRPLSRDPRAPAASAVPPNNSPRLERRPVPPASPPAPPRPQRPGGTLDSGWDRRLKSGSVEPDRVIDLHGFNLDRAWNAIDLGLERAIDSNERILLLITGHARPGAPPVERGKIRAAVHDWLAASRHAGRIAAVRGAHRRHG
ncbi:MAG TPA: Smr/MutS family protein, partial [Sphingomicrobium sp.]|nr:Smr/MutS family protein [Sphingomicrobium sp.]